MKLKEKLKAIKLRQNGKSYGEIRQLVPVSKGTLSVWLRDIKLTLAQKNRIYIELRQKNAYRLAKANQRKRIETTRKIIKKAKKELGQALKNPLFLVGLMLYWAEGDKSDEQEVVKFSNSDPFLITLMIKWFRKICRVPEKKFRIALHVHKLHCRRNIENYWSKLTNIPRDQFHKTQVKPTSLRYRKNKLYNGTCAIVVNNKNLFRRIKGWKLGFYERMKMRL